jgi:predicted RNase H-like nuclease (RuvC/YqgF family)
MNPQDNNFNYKIIFAALVAVIVGILIAYYYGYAQSKNQMSFLEEEKSLLVKDLTLMRAEVDRLSGLNEVNEIELQTSRFRVQQLLDSVGRLNFSITKLKETRKELRKLELRFDSLKLKNNFLRYNNSLLASKYNETFKQLEELRGRASSMERTESLLRETNKELTRELKVKSYLKLQDAEGSGFRLRAGRPIKTNKASTIEKLRGCVTILGDPSTKGDIKVLYLQFLDPNMAVIEDNANTISVSGNTYSKKVEVVYTGKEISFCDAITVPEGSLAEGIYTLNVFEDERLLASTEFQLK